MRWAHLLLAIAVIAPAEASAQTQQELRRLAEQAQARIHELQAEAERLAAQTGTLLGELRTLELDREIKAEAVRKADAELAAGTAALDEAAARLQELENRRVASTPGVRERLVEIYKRGRGGYLRLLLEADDLRAIGRMSRGVAAVARLDRARIDEHLRAVRAERDALAELAARRAEVVVARAEAAGARQALDAAVAAHNRRIDELDRRRDVAARFVGELQMAAAELQRRLQGLPASGAAALPLAPFRGALDWPVTGRIVTRFGRTRDRFGTPIDRNGVEIAAAPGQPVRAVHGGKVAFAAPFTGYGTLVIVDHGDNAFTLYGHLQQASVAQDAIVERGAIVGRAGRNPDGREVVYFEVRIDGRAVDPVQWLRSSR